MLNEPKIIIKNMPDEFNAVYLSDNNHASIYINSKLNNTKKLCVIMHELIHHYYYPACNFYACNSYHEICQCNWIENRINKKVAKTLITDEILASKVLPYVASYSLSELAEEINVTEDILKLRLNIFLNFITEK